MAGAVNILNAVFNIDVDTVFQTNNTTKTDGGFVSFVSYLRPMGLNVLDTNPIYCNVVILPVVSKDLYLVIR